MRKQKSLKKQMMTATLLALLCCSPFAVGSASAQNTNTSPQTRDGSGGPQDGGDGPKRPKNCAQNRTCRPNNSSATNTQNTAQAQGEAESDWLENLWEWFFG